MAFFLPYFTVLSAAGPISRDFSGRTRGVSSGSVIFSFAALKVAIGTGAQIRGGGGPKMLGDPLVREGAGRRRGGLSGPLLG